MKKINKILLISVITLILVISVSYAWFIMSVNQAGINEIVGGNASCLNITKLSETTGITLNNTIPIIDSEGEKLTPYTMTIKNDCNVNVNFVATMELLTIDGKNENDYLGNDLLKVKYDNNTPTIYGSLTDFDIILDNAYVSKMIGYGTIPANGEKTINVRMWVDESGTIENASNKYLNSKVIIHAGQVPNDLKYTVISNATNGTITTNTEQVVLNGTATYNLIPTPGYILDTVTCTSGIPYYNKENNTLVVSNVIDNGTCNITFKESYEISIIANNGVSTPTSKNIGLNDSDTFEVVPNNHYEYSSVTCTSGTPDYSNGTLTVSNVTGSGTCTVNFTPKSYNVSVTATNGVNPSSKSVTHGGNTTFEVTPNEGYEYSASTCTNGNASYNTETNTLTVSNVTDTSSCTVTFTIKKYNVSASAINGTVTSDSPLTINHGSNAEFTITPNTNYEYKSNTCGGSYNTSTNILTISDITNNTICEVEFKAKTYTITYDNNFLENNIFDSTYNTMTFYNCCGTGGTTNLRSNGLHGEIISVTGRNGWYFANKVLLVSGKTYTWTGYFKGSKQLSVYVGAEQGGITSSSVGTEWQRVTKTFTAGDSTDFIAFIYYSWYSPDEDRTLSIMDMQLAEGTLNTDIATKTYGTTMGVLPTPTRVGYTLNGWYTSAYGGTKITTETNVPSQNTTYYAQWSPNTYTVTLNNQNATTAGSTSVTAIYNSVVSNITVPTKTGYTFGGYYTEANGGGTQYYNENGESIRQWNIANNTTLYAKWTIKTYSITASYNTSNNTLTVSNVTGTGTCTVNFVLKSYALNINVTNGTSSPTSRVISHGGSGTYTVTPTSGYTYSGVTCTTGSATYNTSTKILTVTNVTAIGSCTVTFAALGGNKVLATWSSNSIPINTTAPSFSSAATTQVGVYQTPDDYGTSYYVRGSANYNFVKFGKDASGNDYWWRIVRINGDGSVRMIYQGIVAIGSSPELTGFNTSINGVTYEVYEFSGHNLFDDHAYAGYMYTSGQRQGHGTSSNAKTQLEAWYKTNFIDISANATTKNYIADRIFCGDRTSTTDASAVWTTPFTSSGGVGQYGATYYGAFLRLVNSTKSPTLICPEDPDKYTTTTSDYGNKSLTYPIGLITADEVTFAGGVNNLTNLGYYLYTNAYYWTMSPYYFSYGYSGVFVVGEYGALDHSYVINSYGLRPVINLNSITPLKGNGTTTSPFELDI